MDEAQLKIVRHRYRVVIGQQNSVKVLKEVKYDESIIDAVITRGCAQGEIANDCDAGQLEHLSAASQAKRS